jgi:hypothetical protein
MPAGGKRPGAGRPKGSRALTLLAPTGERMSFDNAARQYDEEALRVIASVFMDEKQQASLRLAAANDLLDEPMGDRRWQSTPRPGKCRLRKSSTKSGSCRPIH